MANYIGAIDQGTTSTRFIVFDRSGRIVSVAQKEHEQIYPQPGWVEHDANEIWRRTREVMALALEQRALVAGDLAAIGITNQRETTVVWDRHSGAPVYNALVWQDTRTSGAVAELARHGGSDRFRAKTGLPLATYFSALKIRWILDNVPGARHSAEAGDLLFGNMDTFVLWNLTGGLHLTDCTNASRTQLMHLLQRAQNPLDPGQRPRCAPERRSRRPPVRQHGHLRAVESHRRTPSHRLHQCQPHPTDEPGHAGLGR